MLAIERTPWLEQLKWPHWSYTQLVANGATARRLSLECWIEPRPDAHGCSFHLDPALQSPVRRWQAAWVIHVLKTHCDDLRLPPDNGWLPLV